MNETKLRSELKELTSIREQLFEMLFEEAEPDSDLYKDLLYKYKSQRAEIQLELTKNYKVPVITDPVLRKELQSFLHRGDEFLAQMKKKLGSIDFIKEMERQLSPEFEQARLDEVANELFLSWFNQYDYVDRLINTATIVVKTNELPEKLHRLINELRHCLIFENYLAAGIMLRTIAEVAADDIMAKNFRDVTFKTFGEKLDFLEDESGFGLPASILNTYRKELNDYVHGNKLANSKFIKPYSGIILDQVQKLYEMSGT